jgi:glutamate-1-semialdehyde 2,1-aminomutase
VDGNEYIDYQMGYGALIQGHCPPHVVQAVKEQIEKGTLFGTPHELEIEVTRRICALVPSVETVRFANSGTEAVQGALRTARAYTGRKKIVKFEGHYHGWLDAINLSHLPASADLLGPYEHPTPILATAGQTDCGFRETIVLPWNDLAILEKTFKAHTGEIAAVITEPILFNCSCMMPREGYLEGMRRLTREHGIVLVFDEVQTGFRVSLGGAQAALGVLPDITVMAKALANGYPVSAYGGRREILEGAARKGMAHAGTYNSNPLVLAAIRANLDDLARDNGAAYRTMARSAAKLRAGLTDIYRKAGWPAHDSGPATAFSIMLYEGDEPLRSLRDYFKCDLQTLDTLRTALRARGIYTRPALRDMWYLSAAHTDDDIAKTLAVAAEVVPTIERKRVA